MKSADYRSIPVPYPPYFAHPPYARGFYYSPYYYQEPLSAGIPERFGAWLIDGWGMWITWYAGFIGAALFSLVTGMSGNEIVFLVIMAPISAVGTYWILPLVVWGRTLGKFLVGIQVLSVDTGLPPSLGRTLLRILVLGVCWILFLPLPIAAFFAHRNAHHYTWWDLASRTRVIKISPKF